MSDTPTVPDSPHGEGRQTPTPLLSKKEAAVRLRVTEKTIERYVNEYGLLEPAGQDPRTGAKQFDPVDIDWLRQSPPPRRKSNSDSRGVSELALQGLVAAMQQAHAETVWAKDETIATLRTPPQHTWWVIRAFDDFGQVASLVGNDDRKRPAIDPARAARGRFRRCCSYFRSRFTKNSDDPTWLTHADPVRGRVMVEQ